MNLFPYRKVLLFSNNQAVVILFLLVIHMSMRHTMLIWLQPWLQAVHDGHIQPSGCSVKAVRFQTAPQSAAAQAAQSASLSHHKQQLRPTVSLRHSD